MSGPVLRWRFGESVEALRRHLSGGGIAAIPSESSYGLAGDPRHPKAIENIYRLKSRDRGKPLPVVISDADQLEALGIDRRSAAVRAAEALWPAAFSVVLPFAPELDWPAAAGGATLAVRVPAHAELRRLLRAVGFPLTATSANAAGESPFLDPNELARWLAANQDLDDPPFLVDDGLLPGGAPSTLAMPSAEGWRILRAGRVGAHDLPTLPED